MKYFLVSFSYGGNCAGNGNCTISTEESFFNKKEFQERMAKRVFAPDYSIVPTFVMELTKEQYDVYGR